MLPGTCNYQVELEGEKALEILKTAILQLHVHYAHPWASAQPLSSQPVGLCFGWKAMLLPGGRSLFNIACF